MTTTSLPVASAIAARAVSLVLTPGEVARYSRHLLLPEVGIEGQKRLKAARVLVIGAGGLGSPISLYLAAAGVGVIGIVDHDRVDTSNLQRQILYAEADQGRLKAEAARDRLRASSAQTAIEIFTERLETDNAERILSSFDVIVDGTDNFSTRYLVNDACVLLGKPNVYGSIFRFDGQASVFYAPHGPCYRCLFPSPPPPGQVPSCAEGGVLGVLPAQIGSIQANEALKLILGIGTPLMGRFLTLDALSMRVDEFKIQRDPACPVCGKNPTITTLAASATAVSCELPVEKAMDGDLLAPETLNEWRQSGRAHVLVDVRSAAEHAICNIAGARLLPLPELEGNLASLDPEALIVLHCKAGGRSMTALNLLRAKGFKHLKSLDGGILRWIDVVDKTLTRY